jgi:hypothetical protein
LRIADDCYVVTLRPARQRKPEHTVESEGAVEVAHPDAGMGDTLNSDRLNHSHLHQMKAPLKRPLRRSSQPRRNGSPRNFEASNNL